MNTLNELQVCLLLSIAFHSGLIGSGLLHLQDPPRDSFEVEFEAREEILPRQHHIAEEKKIEKDASEPVVQEEVIEEVALESELKPKDINEELKRSLLRYQDSVKQKIQEEKRYPRKQLRLGREGMARVFFSLLPSGNIRNIRLLHSSGVTDLDEEAIDAVKRAGPFRLFPEGCNEKELYFEIDIAFIINQK
jgi:TonB family protein